MSEDEEDYELPSLFDRVQTALKSHNNLKKSDCETERYDFQKASIGNNSTPCSQIKLKPILFLSDSEDDYEFELLKCSEKNHSTSFSNAPESKNHSTPFVKIRGSYAKKNSYEDLNGSYRQEFQSRRINIEANDSDSDEAFLNIIENIHKSQTPVSQHKKNNGGTTDSDSDEKFSNIIENISRIQTPVTKVVSNKTAESDSDETFSDIIKNLSRIQTPATQNRLVSNEIDESDTDDEFSDIIKNISRIQTPVTQIKYMHHEENESDSDGTFSSITEKLSKIHIPQSQKKNRNVISPVYEKQKFSAVSAKEDESSSLKAINETEYASLFPSKSLHLLSKDQSLYGQKLFKFFNEKVFSSQLPTDMPLIWSNSLLKAAGLTYCRSSNGIRSCSIKLSSKLLTSFDRLQDTLLHEMCHAAVWMISKGNEQHGPLWKIWAWRCKVILPFVECPERCHNYDIPYRVWYQCLNCNWRIGRCRQSQKLEKSICKKCKIPIVMTTK